MIKQIDNSFNFSENSIIIINKNFCKQASSFEETKKYIKQCQPEPDRTKLLALFLGAKEFYGCNKNGDAFPEKELINCHRTFKDHGKVYMHHQNKDPNKAYGDVEFVTYNPRMHRVEGIMSLHNGKCSDILQQLERGEDIAVSMACKVKSDFCSICNHESPTFEDYCDHLKHHMCEIMEDGKQVCAINPDPIFFDISVVWHPADPTAYVLKKVASINNNIEEKKKFHNSYVMNKKSIYKSSILGKISDIEKEIEGTIAGKVDNGNIKNVFQSIVNRKNIPSDCICKLKKYNLDETLSSLTNNKILLKLNEFLKLIGKDDYIDDVSNILPGSFSRMEENDIFDFPEKENNDDINNLLKNILSDRYEGDDYFDNITEIIFSNKPKTIIERTPHGVSIKKTMGSGKIIFKKSNNNFAEKLAKLYNSYKLDFFSKNKSAKIAAMIVADNYIK